MLQIQLDRFGGPEVLEPVSVDDPLPGPGEVLVRTLAAGVTFVDTQLRAGRPPWSGPPPRLPLVLGNGVAGVVSAAGDSTGRELLGRTVVTATGGSGGYADRVVVPSGAPIPLPDAIPPADGVALLADGRTATGLVRAADVRPGDRVLVLAAAGGVGTLLVQLARARGADLVVAAAGTGAKLALAAELGAHETVDYTRPGWADELRHRVGTLTVVFDGVGGRIGADALGLARPAARFAGFGGASGRLTAAEDVASRGLRLIRAGEIATSPEDNRLLVESALSAAAAGRLRVVLGRRFPLAEAASAHAAIEARTTVGKTVLDC